MPCEGRVRQGVVVFEAGEPPGEGQRVLIVPIGDDPAEVPSSLSDVLLKFAGTARGLPSDLAENHDHYLHGQPRR